MNLKELRNNKNLTQEELANELNMSRTRYIRYELHTAEPDLSTLIKLADYFHVTVDALLGHEVPYLLDKSLLTDKQNKIISRVVKLNDNQCDRVDAFIDGMDSDNK